LSNQCGLSTTASVSCLFLHRVALGPTQFVVVFVCFGGVAGIKCDAIFAGDVVAAGAGISTARLRGSGGI